MQKPAPDAARQRILRLSRTSQSEADDLNSQLKSPIAVRSRRTVL
jgi:hypothetical protein